MFSEAYLEPTCTSTMKHFQENDKQGNVNT